MNILEQIIVGKRMEIAGRKLRQPMNRLPELSASVPDFRAALRVEPIGLIAEVKRKSPSAGIIRNPLDPASIAREYAAHGATSVSCLMDSSYFGGGDSDFYAVREAVALPLLYKEFVVDVWQIAHARSMGASGVLLIAGALDDHELADFLDAARAYQLTSLLEVHNEKEMERAANAGADCVGINNRDLKSFETTLDTTFKLASLVPEGCTLVSESGIKHAADVSALKAAGAQAILVGESLLRAASPGAAIDLLLRDVRAA